MQQNHEKRQCLEQLSMQQLENLLLQDFLAVPDGKTDVTQLQEVLEVMEKRSGRSRAQREAEIQQAWKCFQAFYQEEPAQASEKKKRGFRTAMAIVLVAAVLLALSLIPVASYGSIWELVGHWTAEQFSFGEPTEEEGKGSGWQDIHQALAHYGVAERVFPEAPEGFVQTELQVFERESTGTVFFHANYLSEHESLSMYVTLYQKSIETRKYELKNGNGHLTVINDKKYYLISNSKTEVATWITGSLECAIDTTLSKQSLISMLESIE